MNYFIENEKRLAAAFLLYGITSASVTFDGSGDSGQIDSVTLMRGSELFTEDYPVTLYVQGPTQFNPETKAWERSAITETEFPLTAAVQRHVDDALDNSSVDWYNNDGGFGHWEWTAQHGLEFSIDQRVVESHTAHYESRDLGQDEEEPTHWEQNT